MCVGVGLVRRGIMGGGAQTMKIIKLTAPSHWASYLINGDDSGLDAEERAACDAWIAREGVGEPVGCEA